MTAAELAAVHDLDLRVRRTSGVWHVEARGLDLAGSATPTGPTESEQLAAIGEAARQVLSAASDEIHALAPAAERGVLMAPGVRRLERLRVGQWAVGRLAKGGAQ